MPPTKPPKRQRKSPAPPPAPVDPQAPQEQTIVVDLKVDPLIWIAPPLRPLAVFISTLREDPTNARNHPAYSIAGIRASLERFGQMKPIVVDAAGVVRAGNGTLAAARAMGQTMIAVVRSEHLSAHEIGAYALADNRSADLSGWDPDRLAASLGALPADLQAAAGWSGDDLAKALGLASGSVARPKLSDRFLVPPFSVLDARQGYWTTRKDQWTAIGIDGQAGRFGGAGQTYNIGSKTDYEQQKAHGSTPPHGPSVKRGPDGKLEYEPTRGTSVFDPVLCELVYRWFCPAGGRVLDPFAGESTKGIVAAVLGYDYTGIELREEQIRENEAQAARIGVAPRWIQGDSAQLSQIIPADGPPADLVWTSPPYFDLEIYSDRSADGSALQTYAQFMEWYRGIFRQAAARLADNRFLVVKVGEIRDKATGAYRDFVGDNVACMRDAGLHYYNEIVLVTAVGSLAIRAGRQFNRSRKVGKTHQNVLVFWKGDPAAVGDHVSDVLAPDQEIAIDAADGE